MSYISKVRWVRAPHTGKVLSGCIRLLQADLLAFGRGQSLRRGSRRVFHILITYIYESLTFIVRYSHRRHRGVAHSHVSPCPLRVRKRERSRRE